MSRGRSLHQHLPEQPARCSFPHMSQNLCSLYVLVVSRLAALGGHRRLGLDTTEHDGTLVGSRPASFSLPPSLSLHLVDATGCIVLFAVEPALAAPWSSEGFGAAMSRARLKGSQEESRDRRDPSRQGRHFTARGSEWEAVEG